MAAIIVPVVSGVFLTAKEEKEQLTLVIVKDKQEAAANSPDACWITLEEDKPLNEDGINEYEEAALGGVPMAHSFPMTQSNEELFAEIEGELSNSQLHEDETVQNYEELELKELMDKALDSYKEEYKTVTLKELPEEFNSWDDQVGYLGDAIHDYEPSYGDIKPLFRSRSSRVEIFSKLCYSLKNRPQTFLKDIVSQSARSWVPVQK